MGAIRTILLPTDFSRHSEYAWGMARSLARDHGARLVVLHVRFPDLLLGGSYPLPPQDPQGQRQLLLEELQRHCPAEISIAVEHLVKDGDPASEILQCARALNADLIVLGTHGRSGMGRLLLGSVAEKVVRRASCPVLTVKVPTEDISTASPFALGGP